MSFYFLFIVFSSVKVKGNQLFQLTLYYHGKKIISKIFILFMIKKIINQCIKAL